jgi:hypothetical protein
MDRATIPFDSIESAQQFVIALAEKVLESKQELELDLNREPAPTPSRRADALGLAVKSLHDLDFCLGQSRRILNDLRSLRRLMLDERSGHATTSNPRVSTVEKLPTAAVQPCTAMKRLAITRQAATRPDGGAAPWYVRAA